MQTNNSDANVNKNYKNNLIDVGHSCIIPNHSFKYDKPTWFQGSKGRYFPTENNNNYMRIYDNKQILEKRGLNPLIVSSQF